MKKNYLVEFFHINIKLVEKFLIDMQEKGFAILFPFYERITLKKRFSLIGSSLVNFVKGMFGGGGKEAFLNGFKDLGEAFSGIISDNHLHEFHNVLGNLSFLQKLKNTFLGDKYVKRTYFENLLGKGEGKNKFIFYKLRILINKSDSDEIKAILESIEEIKMKVHYMSNEEIEKNKANLIEKLKIIEKEKLKYHKTYKHYKKVIKLFKKYGEDKEKYYAAKEKFNNIINNAINELDIEQFLEDKHKQLFENEIDKYADKILPILRKNLFNKIFQNLKNTFEALNKYVNQAIYMKAFIDHKKN